MNEQEINKVLSEFMGYEVKESGFFDGVLFADSKILGESPTNYTKSLDALIPVVQKLGKTLELNYQYAISGNMYWYSQFNMTGEESSKSPSMALATALAKVIQKNN